MMDNSQVVTFYWDVYSEAYCSASKSRIEAAPGHLPRHLLFAILDYRIQADRLGDLDYEKRQAIES